MFEQQLAGVGCRDKTTLEVLKCDLSLWSAESSIEGHFIVDKRTAPEAHVAVVHQILQLSLILLDLLVGVTYLLVVLLVLQVELSFLCDVSDGERDIDKFFLLIVDRV